MADPIAAIDVSHLTKSYGGHVVLNDLSFTVNAGEVMAVVGPPGCGKTTLARILATAEAPTKGVVRILGFHAGRRPLDARVRLGYMPATVGLEPELTVEEFLEFFLRAYDKDDTAGMAVMADVLELTDMTARRADMIHTLRAADGRKLSLARCLLHDPQALVLDEPLADLNLAGREEVLAILRALRDLGKTLVVCTRSVEAMEGLAQEFCVLDRGVACDVGSAEELRRWHTPHALYELRVAGDVGAAAAIVQKAGALILLRQKDRLRFAADDVAAIQEIEAKLSQAGLRVKGRAIEPALTDVVATCFARRAQVHRATESILKDRQA